MHTLEGCFCFLRPFPARCCRTAVRDECISPPTKMAGREHYSSSPCAPFSQRPFFCLYVETYFHMQSQSPLPFPSSGSKTKIQGRSMHKQARKVKSASHPDPQQCQSQVHSVTQPSCILLHPYVHPYAHDFPTYQTKRPAFSFPSFFLSYVPQT